MSRGRDRYRKWKKRKLKRRWNNSNLYIQNSDKIWRNNFRQIKWERNFRKRKSKQGSSCQMYHKMLGRWAILLKKTSQKTMSMSIMIITKKTIQAKVAHSSLFLAVPRLSNTSRTSWLNVRKRKVPEEMMQWVRSHSFSIQNKTRLMHWKMLKVISKLRLNSCCRIKSNNTNWTHLETLKVSGKIS